MKDYESSAYDNGDNVGRVIDRETQLLFRTVDHSIAMPSSNAIGEMMTKLHSVVFNDFDCCCEVSEDRLRRMLYDIYITLFEQTDIALSLGDATDNSTSARRLALQFSSQLHELRRVIFTDVHAIMHNDPAARSPHEVITSYPAIKALLHYRTAHMLLNLGAPLLPRMITEQAHSETGIDIHPGARIGEYFGIDHGTGVVIGETCIIGTHVTLYQGVTLGARNFEYDDNGKPMNVARHPIIEDNVTIYSNTSVLGRITVGHDTVIGGNVWLTHSVAPYSHIVQSKSRSEAAVIHHD